MHKTHNSKCQWHTIGKLTRPRPGNMVDAMGMACLWQTDPTQAWHPDRYHGYGNEHGMSMANGSGTGLAS